MAFGMSWKSQLPATSIAFLHGQKQKKKMRLPSLSLFFFFALISASLISVQIKITSDYVWELNVSGSGSVVFWSAPPELHHKSQGHHEPVGLEETLTLNWDDISLQPLPAALFPKCPLPSQECFIMTTAHQCWFESCGWDWNIRLWLTELSRRERRHGWKEGCFNDFTWVDTGYLLQMLIISQCETLIKQCK